MVTLVKKKIPTDFTACLLSACHYPYDKVCQSFSSLIIDTVFSLMAVPPGEVKNLQQFLDIQYPSPTMYIRFCIHNLSFCFLGYEKGVDDWSSGW